MVNKLKIIDGMQKHKIRPKNYVSNRGCNRIAQNMKWYCGTRIQKVQITFRCGKMVGVFLKSNADIFLPWIKEVAFSDITWTVCITCEVHSRYVSNNMDYDIQAWICKYYRKIQACTKHIWLFFWINTSNSQQPNLRFNKDQRYWICLYILEFQYWNKNLRHD